MGFPQISLKFRNSKEIMFWGARERIWAPQPLEKQRNYLCFCMPALYDGFLVNSIKIPGNHENPWKSRNVIKFIEFHEIHWFRGFRNPSRNLCIPCSKSWSERLRPPKTCDFIKINDFPKIHQNFNIFRRFPGNSAKTGQNSFWRILVVPWPPHAENLDIPIGILRFLSLPGGPETLPNTKNEEIHPEHEKSAKIMTFHEIS